MANFIEKYLSDISTKFSDLQTSEMGYRTDFENLLKVIFPKDQNYDIHHDAKSVEGNKPDFVVLKNKVPVLYIENKDIGIDLDKIEKSNQMERYFGYNNLILTDQVEFRFYRNGEKYGETIKIATYDKASRSINSLPVYFQTLEKTLIDFTLSHKEPIKRGKHLAQIMGGKAQRIRANVLSILEKQEETDIHKVRNTIKKLLLHDMDNSAFADMYAQTLVYGLFVARFYDETGESFTRQEARELVPKSNPFLAHFFDHISGVNFEKRLSYIVDELCNVFSHANIPDLMDQYFGKDLWGNDKEGPDPVIHFYEDFLKEYDPELRKKMGAYYTPTPVVRFMVRAVDEILQKEFGFAKGLADTSKYENGIHKVQILDPATGTGTFISAVIRHIYEKIIRTGQKGVWTSYVHHDLLPRIHAFELMMGPYTIAHLKLSMAFEKTGFKYFNNTRLGIYLTNSLDEAIQENLEFGDLGLSGSLAEESKEAGKIKNQKPVMVVIGNPPYSGTSQNKEYKKNNDYKVEPGGKQKLQEQKHWLDDDYVKFIRFAESLVERNTQGIVAMITAHGYIDNPTFRGMRWHLRNTFDSIYVVDLHGNSNKKETSLDGGKDENVFDIKTGVSVIFAIKKQNSENKKLATVYKADVFGLRKEKFELLERSSIENIKWQELPMENDLWVLGGEKKDEYGAGFSVSEMLPINNTGICTQRDHIAIQNSYKEAKNILNDFISLNEGELKLKYAIEKDGRDWKIKTAKEDVVKYYVDESYIKKVLYRPFDIKFTFYTGKSKGFIAYPRGDVFKHFFKGENIGLIVSRQGVAANPNNYDTVSVSDTIVDLNYYRRGGEILCPLYLFADQGEKIPNLNKIMWQKINQVSGATTPENILDYIYAVLHSPNYRAKYKEFLKIDFPRVPYPESKAVFWELVKLGEKLRELHLMTSPDSQEINTTYPESGTDEVEKILYKDKKVYINTNQYFGNVPEVAWNFYIGGYQPAQKYLKDRKGRKMSCDEIEHYEKIITALTKTDEVMKEIDEISV